MATSNRVQSRDRSAQDPLPAGLCWCGCDRPTRLAPYTSSKKGWVKGKPLRYIHGHNRRKRTRFVVAPTGYETDCWLWQLCKDKDGYGTVGVASGKMALAHRAYYEERFGPVPEGKELDHLCRVRACVNPEHLEPVTHHENLRRGGRLKLTPRDVAEIRRSTDTHLVIARRFGITQPHVSRIRAWLAWRALPDSVKPKAYQSVRRSAYTPISLQTPS